MESEVPTPTAAAGGAPTARQPANNVPNGEEEDVSMNLGLTASVASASASVVASPAVLSATVASASPVPSTPCATDAAPPAPTQTQMEEDSNEEDEEDIDGESDGDFGEGRYLGRSRVISTLRTDLPYGLRLARPANSGR